MSEIRIWVHVLEWGIAQNSELPSDVANYSKDDFNILKNTLQQCIPFIKFYDLTSKEFHNKILPYKRIFPKEMYKDLLIFYLDQSESNNKSSDDSDSRITREINLRTVDLKIITYQHIELISIN
ncbi:BTB/POZ protein [Rhizophagus clarus]|nr:BTB/POZ protein [Rhizophagus clarus]